MSGRRMFRVTAGEVIQPQGYTPKGSAPKKGDRGSKPEAKAEAAEE